MSESRRRYLRRLPVGGCPLGAYNGPRRCGSARREVSETNDKPTSASQRHLRKAILGRWRRRAAIGATSLVLSRPRRGTACFLEGLDVDEVPQGLLRWLEHPPQARDVHGGSLRGRGPLVGLAPVEIHGGNARAIEVRRSKKYGAAPRFLQRGRRWQLCGACRVLATS